MKMIIATGLSLALGLGAATSRATTRTVGADEGHDGVSRDMPVSNFCDFTPFQFSPAISCNNFFSGIASGFYNWQIPLAVSGSSSTLTTLTATGTALIPIINGGNQPTEQVQARLLNWNQTGGLLCSTNVVTWAGQSPSPSSRFLGACTINPTTDRPEAEFLIGHVNGFTQAQDPRVYGVNYTY
jgi:hypothetical protein